MIPGVNFLKYMRNAVALDESEDLVGLLLEMLILHYGGCHYE
jgi:hypothetical protein